MNAEPKFTYSLTWRIVPVAANTDESGNPAFVSVVGNVPLSEIQKFITAVTEAAVLLAEAEAEKKVSKGQ